MAKSASVMESPAKKKRVGRPEIKIDYQKAEALAARGMDKKDIALCLGMKPSTLQLHQKKDSKFQAALDRGQAAGIAAVTGQLLKGINLGNMTAIIFYLKCRAHWKETSVLETRDLPALPPEDCTPEEAERAYIKSMRS